MRKSLCGLLPTMVGFAAVLAGLVLGAGAAEAQRDFTVTEDAFSISNAPGYCFAMAAFSRWYYLTGEGRPPLRKALSTDVQQRIASELQKFYSTNLVTIQANYCNSCHEDPRESIQQFLAGLAKGEPRIVLLMNKSGRGAILHAVLAYEWVPERNIVKVYDPNYTNQERVIDLDQRRYTSLDVGYTAICFPEVLNDHSGLVHKMEALYDTHVARRSVAAAGRVQTRAR